MLHAWTAYKRTEMLLLLIPLFFYGILITSVRSNWIGAAAALICWFVIFGLKKNGQRIAVITVAVLCVFLYQFVDDQIHFHRGGERMPVSLTKDSDKQKYIDLMVTNRVSAITNPFEEHSMLSRLALWKYMFILSRDPEKALLGRGTGALNAESLYVTYLAEFGYPGFIFIIGLFCVFIIKGMRMIDTVQDKRTIVFVKGIVCMDLALALMNITGTHIHAFPGDAYFWLFNGVLIGKSSFFKTMTEERGLS
jgi:cell division protein FtsW (lipid II flippase)